MENLNNMQITALEDMIKRRMESTNESREEACDQIANFFQSIIDQKRAK